MLSTAKVNNPYQTFFNRSPNYLFISTLDGTILEINDAVVKGLGYSKASLIGQTLHHVFPVETHQNLQRLIERTSSGETQQGPSQLVRAEGTKILVNTRLFAAMTDQGWVIMTMCVDLRALSAVEQKFAKTFQNSGSMMMIINTEGGAITDVNPSFLQRFNYTMGDVLGKTTGQLRLFAHPKDRDHLMQRILQTHSERDVLLTLQNSRGEPIEVQVNLDLIDVDNTLHFVVSMTDLTHRIALQSQIEAQNRNLQAQVDAKVREISEAQLAMVSALSNLTESRDNETGNHIERISRMSTVLAQILRCEPDFTNLISDDFITTIGSASILHDIGKIGISDLILLKPDQLTRQEFEIMKEHVMIGVRLIRKIRARYANNSYLTLGEEIILTHHEKWDGSGYPQGLKGSEIPLSGQIVALCDVYDALRSHRPYKEPLSHAESLIELAALSGKHFDPRLLSVFLAHADAFEHLDEAGLTINSVE